MRKAIYSDYLLNFRVFLSSTISATMSIFEINDAICTARVRNG